jgi:HEAT repeat protein
MIEGDIETRKNVLILVKKLGPVTEIYMYALIANLSSEDGYLRSQSANLLTQFGPKAKAAIPALKEMLRVGHQYVHHHAAIALTAIGIDLMELVPGYMLELESKSAQTRREACTALQAIAGKARIAGPLLIKTYLTDADPGVRGKAIYSLSCIGAPLDDVVSSLTKVIQTDKDASVRRTACSCLGRMAAATEKAIPGLIAGLKDADLGVRRAAAAQFHRFGIRARTAAAPLVDAFASKDLKLSNTARDSLMHIVDPSRAVPGLIKLLEDKTFYRRNLVPELLSCCGAKAAPAIPALEEAIDTLDLVLRKNIIVALGNIGSASGSSVLMLIAVVNDKLAPDRKEAIVSIGKIGPAASEALSTLVKVLNDTDSPLRKEAAIAIGKIGLKTTDNR